ncbi:MAG: tetratricopeptide repeat protein [Bryobacterales bacterium]|nr:tetratricopeptide repeat protein [Bryobacterales bacterium]
MRQWWISLVSVPVLSVFYAAAQQAPSPDVRAWIAEAQRQLQLRQFDAAGNAARQALALEPNLAEGEALLGFVATMKGDFSEAERRFHRATQLQPGNAHLHGYLGSTYLQQKRLKEARASFETVLKLDAANQAATYNLGLIALLENRPTEALASFQAVLKMNRSDAAALIGVLESQLLLKQSKEAEETTRRLETILGPGEPRLAQVAALLASHGEYRTAIPIFENLYKQGASRDVSFNLALAHLKTGNANRAAEVLGPLLSGADAEIFHLLATVEEARQRPIEASQAYRRASELEAGSEVYRFDYGNALLQHESVEAAVAVFARGVRDFPESWRMRLGLGSSYYLAEQYESAAEALLEAVEREPSAELTYYLLGKAYESAGAMQEKIRERFRQYLAGNPKDSWAYYHYAIMLYENSRALRQDVPPVVVSHLKKALQLDPNLAEAHQQLGVLAMERGEMRAAIANLECAIQLDANLATAHYRLGLAYRKTGLVKKAAAEMNIFRRLKAHHPAGVDRGRVLRSLAGIAR